MTQYPFTPTPEQEAGLIAACDVHNANLAETEGFVPLDPAGYHQFVMSNACDSYAKQYAPAKVFTDDAKLVGKTFTNEKGEAFEVALAPVKEEAAIEEAVVIEEEIV